MDFFENYGLYGIDSVSNNGRLFTLCEQGRLDPALDHLEQLEAPASNNLYLSLLKLCTKQKALPQAKRLCTHLLRHNCNQSAFLFENLILTLAKCGGIDEAYSMFTELPSRSVFSWTAIISGFVESGQSSDALRMHKHMLQDGFEPDAYTFASLFKACGVISDIETGRHLHSVAKIKGFTSDTFVLTAILSMYSKCGCLEEAEGIFLSLPRIDLVSWSAMLSAYVENGQCKKGLQVLRQMFQIGMHPNQQSMVIALQACSLIADKGEDDDSSVVEIGKALHSYVREKGFMSNVFVHTTLVSMYAKCDALLEAENVFTGQQQHHLSLWNAMLSAYVEEDYGEKALQLFVQMQSAGVSPDERTYVIVLQACVTLAESEERNTVKARFIKNWSLEIGQALHADAEKKRFSSNVFVGTTLIALYGKCGSISKAEDVFHGLLEQTCVAWNAMLCAYIEQGKGEKVLTLYKKMEMHHIPLDVTSLISILQACSEIGDIDMCWKLHFTVVSTEHDLDIFLCSALIHAYGSCASMVDAQLIYEGESLTLPNNASWNACIAGYAGEGNCDASLEIFEGIRLGSFIPDAVTYASIISACNHAGLVNEALEYFISMTRDYNVVPDRKHYVSITDLLGRAGDFRRVCDIIQKKTRQADLTMWLFLLGACRTHGNPELARDVFSYAISLAPTETSAYVSMSNICAG